MFIRALLRLQHSNYPSEPRILSKPKVVVKVIRFWENRRGGCASVSFKLLLKYWSGCANHFRVKRRNLHDFACGSQVNET